LVVAGDHSAQLSFSPAELSFERVADYDVVKLPGLHLMNRIGEPALPVRNVYVAIPGNVQVTGIDLISFDVTDISGSYNIYPAQPPVPTKKDAKPGPFVQPKASIYGSTSPYPENVIKYMGTGSLGGQRIAMLQVFPVQYVPSQGVLKFYDHINFQLVTQPIDNTTQVPRRSNTAQLTYKKICQDLVVNPEDVIAYSQKGLSPSDLEYLIITGDEFVSSFQPLADWKTQKGIPGAIRTTSWINSNYSGVDMAEKIRNYLKIAYQDSGTVWVLLGGDTGVIPCRYVHIELESLSEDIPADLYYSDLDGDWNYDGDSWYGEPEDSLDLLPDVFVGRAPASNIEQVERFVNKVLTYTNTPPSGYQTKGLFFAEYMDAQTDQGICKDIIDENYIPDSFGPVVKLYERLGNLNSSTVVDSLDQGFNIANHCGHANYNVLSTGPDYIYTTHFDNLSNAPRYTGIFLSGGCWPAAIDNNCIGERFVNAPNGGGFFVGNSRYGWFSPTFPGYGSSDIFDQAFFDQVFVNSEPRLGVALAASKVMYAADAQMANDYRWLCLCLILLGDPEMSLWTLEPSTPVVNHPDTIVIGESEFVVSVSSNNEPVANASVCISKASEIFQRELTGANGQARFTISPATGGDLNVAVTGYNYLPYEGTCAVVSTGPQIVQCGFVADDALGNNDGVVNPGETILMSVNLTNSGNQTAYAVVGSLSTPSTLVDAISDDIASYGDMSADDTASGEFSFDVSSTASDRDVILFDLHITADGGLTWFPQVPVMVGTPVLKYYISSIIDIPGGDGFADPGDTVDLTLTIRNKGLGNGEDIYGILNTDDAYIDIMADSSWFGDLSAGIVKSSSIPYQLAIDEACPSHHLALLSLTLVGNDYSSIDSFLFPIGDLSFFDDMESGEGGWTHSGTSDEWHITTHRSYSGDHSWYCGNEGFWLYDMDFTAYLTSPLLLIRENQILQFWTWHYIESGWDYAFCEINPGNGWRELGMVTGQSGDWVQKTYDLSEYAGDTAQIRFSFFSDYDWNQFEGWYIDDVEILTYNPEFVCGDCNSDGIVDPGDVVYLINYLFREGPDPFPLIAGDCNCDSVVGPGDVVYLINYLFRGGPVPDC
jgi:hypothetical protein